MSDKSFLKTQIARARRLAAAQTNVADRDRLLAFADHYQRQIDTASDAATDKGVSDEQPQATQTISDAAPSDVGAAENSTSNEQPEID